MSRFVQIFATTTLCLIVALAGVAMARTHGQMRDATGSIVICSGGAAVTVQVDAEGNPVDPVPVCPDCALCGVVSAGPGPGMSAPFEAEQRLSFVIEPMQAAGLERTVPRARGPPWPDPAQIPPNPMTRRR